MKEFLVVIGLLICATAVSAEPRLRNQNPDRLQESVAKFTKMKLPVDVMNEREMKRQGFRNTIQKLTAPDAFRAVRPVVEEGSNPNRRNLGK